MRAEEMIVDVMDTIVNEREQMVLNRPKNEKNFNYNVYHNLPEVII